MREITLDVPDMVHATYLVPAQWPSGPPALDRWPDQLRELAADFAAQGFLTVDSHAAQETPPLPPVHATEWQRAELDAAPWRILVRAGYLPGWPPLHEWTARLVAAELARQNSGIFLDFADPTLLDADTGAASLPTEQMPFPLTRWVTLDWSVTDIGVSLWTSGLARFGLPRLRSGAVREELLRPWGAVVNGLAWRLCVVAFEALGADRGTAQLRLPETLKVSAADVRAAQGKKPEEDGGGSAQLRLEELRAVDDSPAELLIERPRDFDGPPDGFAAQVCREVFGPGLGVSV